MTGLVGALVFLTRLPIRTERQLRTSSSVPWFPFVGALIGAMVGGAVALAQPWATPTVAAVIGVTLGLLVTGCFHEDGLADVADAFVGGWTREDRLRILKDPRHGTYGVTAIAASLLVRVAAVTSVVAVGPRHAFAACVAAHSIGRMLALAVMVTSRPATGEGLGHDYVDDIGRTTTVAGAAIGAIVATLAIGWWAGLAIGVGSVLTGVVVRWSTKKVGGFTGDVLGAVEQVVEASTLVVVSILAQHHPLWWA